MSIVNSVLAFNQEQADGSRIVYEVHTDHLGGVHELRYTPGAGVDVTAMLAAHATRIEEQLAQEEIAGLLDG
jgi:hypothetical protein